MRARRIQVVLTAGAGLALVALALVPGSPSRARATSSPWPRRAGNCYSLASNYNPLGRPPLVAVRNGTATP